MPDIELKTKGIVWVLAAVLAIALVMMVVNRYDAKKAYVLFQRQEQVLREASAFQELSRSVCRVDFKSLGDANRIRSLIRSIRDINSAISDVKVIYKMEEGYYSIPCFFDETRGFERIVVLNSFEQKAIAEMEKGGSDCIRSSNEQLGSENALNILFLMNADCHAYLSVSFQKERFD